MNLVPKPAADEVVFVDLDRCLLIDDSISAFLTRLVDLQLVPRSAIFRGALAYVSYRLNLADPTQMIYKGVEHLNGIEESILEEEAERFFSNVARFRYRQSVVQAIEKHQAANQPVYILTGGLPYLTKYIADDLGMEGFGCTQAETKNRVFTGRVYQPPCVGEGKIVHAQKIVEQTDQTLAHCWFYTDSYSDLPMLKVATYPIAVNPDRKLRRWAEKHDWIIQH